MLTNLFYSRLLLFALRSSTIPRHWSHYFTHLLLLQFTVFSFQHACCCSAACHCCNGKRHAVRAQLIGSNHFARTYDHGSLNKCRRHVPGKAVCLLTPRRLADTRSQLVAVACAAWTRFTFVPQTVFAYIAANLCMGTLHVCMCLCANTCMCYSLRFVNFAGLAAFAS